MQVMYEDMILYPLKTSETDYFLDMSYIKNKRT